MCQEFTVAAHDVRSYTGMRESQIQDWQRLCADILRRMLPILDNVTPFLTDEQEQMADFAKVVHGRFMTELSTIGVRVIAPNPGDPFDARLHLLHPETSGLPPYQVKVLVAPGFLFRARVSGANEVILRAGRSDRRTDSRAGTTVPAASMLDETVPAAAAEDIEQRDEREGAPDETPAANAPGDVEVMDASRAGDTAGLTPLPTDDEADPDSTDAASAAGADEEAMRELPGDDEMVPLWAETAELRKVWVVEGGDIMHHHSGAREEK